MYDYGNNTSQFLFLSTPSARRATVTSPDARLDRSISIHALREEGDLGMQQRAKEIQNFYPRPPRGGRQQKQRKNTLLLS